MKCPKCGSEKITVINQPIQLKEKTDSAIIDIITVLAILALIFGITAYIGSKNSSKELPLYVISIALMKWPGITLVSIGILNALRPHKMKNQIIYICLKCGYSAELPQLQSEDNNDDSTIEQNTENK